MEKVLRVLAAAGGAVLSFVTGISPIMGLLVGVMTIDLVTGILCGAMGRSPKTDTGGLSSRAAFEGLLRKCIILLVVLLAVLLDLAVQTEAGVQFSAVSGATCLWFISSEGVSVLENASRMGLPIPGVLTRALDIVRAAGEDGETKTTK